MTEINLNSIGGQVLNSFLGTIEDSFQKNSSQLKLINYGTGSGKTHQLFQAIYQTIEKHPDRKIIGIYIAPLREHLSVPGLVKDQYPDIPVYKINSLEMKATGEYLNLYKKWIPLILKNKSLWQKSLKVSSDKKVQEFNDKLNTVQGLISRLEYIKRFGLVDKNNNESETNKAIRELNRSLESFLEFLVKCELDKANCSEECFKLMEIFFPLHLLREKSGILMLTYDKFATKIPYFEHKGDKWVKKTNYLDKYVVQHTDNSKKFIFAFDEQEDGYQIILKNNIDIISPEDMAINNALSSIYREFSLLFAKQNIKPRELLNFLAQNPGAFREFQEHVERGKILEPGFQEHFDTYKKITHGQGNSTKYIEDINLIKQGLEKCLSEVVKIFNHGNEEAPVSLDFDMLSRVLAKFENARSLVISKDIYNKISNDLMNIFTYNNLYIYNIEALQNLFLSKPSGGHVHIFDKKVSDKTSIAELIYAIIAMRSQVEKIKRILSDVLDAEDSQSRALGVWSQQITKVQKADEETGGKNELRKHLSRSYVYESNKSIINIKEISRYNNLIEPELREVSIGSTAIFTSPEHKINSILASNNIIFLISATGGITGDLTTSYDFSYLEDKLRDKSGQSLFQPMTEEETLLCENIRNFRQKNRQITVSFFNQDASYFPNEETQEIVARFKELILKDFIENIKNDKIWFSKYKKQELTNFVHFLFYLFEDDSLQETIAFTQSLRWIHELMDYCISLKHDNFVFEKSSEHPNIFYVRINHPKYKSNVRIKLILYKASFNKDYYDKKNQKTYLDELVEKEGEKIFFISAYQSASKGLNPIIKTQNNEEKDFDSLVLLMDSHYTVMNSFSKKYQNKESDKSTAHYHFALMKSIVNLSESEMLIKDFNQYLSDPEATKFRNKQHQILLGKGTLQAIGRSERRYFPKQVSKIFINEETRKSLLGFYKYLEQEEAKEIRKLSLNNYQVYLRVKEEENKRAIKDYDGHVYDEIDAQIAFQEFKDEMLKEIELFHQNENTFEIVKAWEGLRDPLVFQNPAKYLEKLRKSKLFPDAFIESLFYYNPEQPEFTPYLASEEDNGKKIQIISDSINGETIYTYKNRLYPEYLKNNTQGHDIEGNEISSRDNSTNSIWEIYNKLVPNLDIFNSYIPRRSFFYDVLYPSLAENFVERWIKDVIFQGKHWKNIKILYGFEQLSDFKKYPKLYELFDLYYAKDNILFCIDVKAWSQASGNRLSSNTVKKAKNKLKQIAEDYSKFTTTKGLLLNLYAPKAKNTQHPSKPHQLFSGNLIYLDSHNFPVDSNILKEFLLPKQK